MTADPVLIEYESTLCELQTRLGEVRRERILAVTVLMTATALLLTLSFYAVRKRAPAWWPILPIPLIAGSALRWRCLVLNQSRMWRLMRFYGRGVLRMKGRWKDSTFTGDEFKSPDHAYAGDLNVLGEGSLFALLCIARTGIGRRGLAAYLLDVPAIEEAEARQKAVRELQDRRDLREAVALLGEFEFSEARWGTFEDWLGSPAVSLGRHLRPMLAATSSVIACAVLAGALGILPWLRVLTWIWPVVLFHSVMGLTFRSRVNAMTDSLRNLWTETEVLQQGLRVLETQRFQGMKLNKLVESVRNSSQSVRKLDRLVGALYERNKDWFYLPSRVLMLGTQLWMAIEQWRIQNGAALRIWLDAWAEFEALNSVANYAYENRDNTYALFLDGEAHLEARALGHPLIDKMICVRNDIQLNSTSRFYVISGSNMSGKSTLLRAIGLNAVLAFAGAPVRAQAFRLSRLPICASLSVVDSLLNGKSKFLAEVERLRHAIRLATANGSVLFLIDEILGGTNSRDRRTASEAIVRTLVTRGGIGALSTHDVALTEIAEAEGLGGVNVHLGSKHDGDPMDFDYLLKPGATKEANALAIARLAGVLP